MSALAACSSSDETRAVSECPDAAVVVDAGPPAVDAAPDVITHPVVTSPQVTQLRAATNVELIGITKGSEPYAVYWVVHYEPGTTDTRTWDLEAAPIYGGPAIVIATDLDDDDPAVVNGGAVAWWKTTSSDSLSATAIGIWTPDTGPKLLTTGSQAGIFAATDDGAMVAYSAGADGESTSLFITPSSKPVITGAAAFSGATAVNLIADSPNCTPQIGFAGTTLIGAFCVGTDGTDDQPKLFTVDNTGAVTTRIDMLPELPSDEISWSADSTGTKIFVQKFDAQDGVLVVTNGQETSVSPLGEIDEGVMTPAGMVVALSNGELVTFDASAKETMVAPASFLYLLAPDGKTLAFSKNRSLTDTTDTDLAVVDVTAQPPKVVTVAPDAQSIVDGFTGDSSLIIYRNPITTDALGTLEHGPLFAMPASGGTPVKLADDSYISRPALAGTGLVTTSTSALSSDELTSETFGYVDATKGGAASNVSSILRFSQGLWSDRVYVYEDLGLNAGIYALEVP